MRSSAKHRKNQQTSQQPQDRVALLLPSLFAGGAEAVMVELASQFQEAGVRVDLVLGRATGPYLNRVPAGVRVIDLNRDKMLQCLPGLLRYLAQERPRALLSALDHTNVIACLAKTLHKQSLRVILSCHNSFSAGLQQLPDWKATVQTVLARWLYRKADKLVAVSAGVASDVISTIGLPASMVEVIHNPIPVDRIRINALQPAPLLDQIPPGFAVIVGVGRLVKEKDFTTLLRAFNLVHRERQAYLVLLGEGEERVALEMLAKDLGIGSQTLFTGFIQNPYSYMARASVVVLSSRREGFGNVLAEALACGTPVVSTDCEHGPREVLGAGQWGKLVPVGDVPGLAAAILKTLAEGCDERAVRMVRERFSAEQAALGYLNLLIPASRDAV